MPGIYDDIGSNDTLSALNRKIARLQDRTREKTERLRPDRIQRYEPATLQSITDADTLNFQGVTGGLGGYNPNTKVQYDMTGKPTGDRQVNFDAYEVPHDGSNYINSRTGIKKMARQRQHLADQLNVPVELVTDEMIHTAGMNQTFDALAQLNTQGVDLISRTMNEDGTGNIFGRDKPLNLPVERADTGEYGYFGRPLTDTRGIGGESIADTFNTPEQNTDYRLQPNQPNGLQPKSTQNVYQLLDELNKTYTNPDTVDTPPDFIDNMLDIPGSVAGGIVGGGMNLAEGISKLGAKGINAVFDTDYTGELFGKDTIDNTKHSVSETLGVDKEDREFREKNFKELGEKAFKDVKLLDTSTYDKTDMGALGTLFWESLKDPNMMAESLGSLVGSGLGWGAVAKTGAKVISKVTAKKVAAMATAKGSNVASAVGSRVAKTTEARVARLLGTKYKTQIGYGFAMANDVDNQYAKNNNGEHMELGKYAGTVIASTLLAFPEVAAMKFGFGGGTKEISDTVKGKIKNVLVGVLTASGYEAVQETADQIFQTGIARYGTEEYKDQPLADILNDATAEILSAGVMGATGGAQMRIASETPKAVTGTVKGVYDKVVGPSNVDFADPDVLANMSREDVATIREKDLTTLKETKDYRNATPEEQTKLVDDFHKESKAIIDKVDARVETRDVADKQVEIEKNFEDVKQKVKDVEPVSTVVEDNEVEISNDTRRKFQEVDEQFTSAVERLQASLDSLTDETATEDVRRNITNYSNSVLQEINEWYFTNGATEVDEQGNVTNTNAEDMFTEEEIKNNPKKMKAIQDNFDKFVTSFMNEDNTYKTLDEMKANKLGDVEIVENILGNSQASVDDINEAISMAKDEDTKKKLEIQAEVKGLTELDRVANEKFEGGGKKLSINNILRLLKKGKEFRGSNLLAVKTIDSFLASQDSKLKGMQDARTIYKVIEANPSITVDALTANLKANHPNLVLGDLQAKIDSFNSNERKVFSDYKTKDANSGEDVINYYSGSDTLIDTIKDEQAVLANLRDFAQDFTDGKAKETEEVRTTTETQETPTTKPIVEEDEPIIVEPTEPIVDDVVETKEEPVEPKKEDKVGDVVEIKDGDFVVYTSKRLEDSKAGKPRYKHTFKAEVEVNGKVKDIKIESISSLNPYNEAMTKTMSTALKEVYEEDPTLGVTELKAKVGARFRELVTKANNPTTPTQEPETPTNNEVKEEPAVEEQPTEFNTENTADFGMDEGQPEFDEADIEVQPDEYGNYEDETVPTKPKTNSALEATREKLKASNSKDLAIVETDNEAKNNEILDTIASNINELGDIETAELSKIVDSKLTEEQKTKFKDMTLTQKITELRKDC